MAILSIKFSVNEEQLDRFLEVTTPALGPAVILNLLGFLLWAHFSLVRWLIVGASVLLLLLVILGTVVQRIIWSRYRKQNGH